MSVSTDAILCFGINMAEINEDELPWAKDGDIDRWWLIDVHGWTYPVKIWDPDGGKRCPGITDKDVEAYFSAYGKAMNSMPKLPVEIVYHCSDRYPEIILAIPGTVHEAGRGFPQKIEPDELRYEPGSMNDLLAFCEKYLSGLTCEDGNPPHKQRPEWILCSWWDGA